VSENIPEKIGKYPVESLIARGGMGAVYKALHPELKRAVIIKKLTLRGNASAAERFKREARILLDLNHPHVVHLHDYFQDERSRYLVMEYVDGMSLDRLLKRKGRFSGPMALLVVLEACTALKYAHDRGIVHRDVKPGNILISRKGTVKLADFGIAQDGGEASPGERTGPEGTQKNRTPGTELTMAGSVLGTPSYMPPEQFADSSSVDQRADIYAAGVMLYEMMTGVKPFPGGNTPETREAILRGKYTPMRKLAPDAPFTVVRLARRMMKARAKGRFRDLKPVIRIATRYLKRYSVRDIRFAMVQNMLTARREEPVFAPRKRTALRLLIALVAALAAGSLSLAAWKGGLVHRTVLRPWFAPVTVRVNLGSPEEAQGALGGDLQFRAFFFRDDRSEIPEVTGTRRILERLQGDDAVESAPVWLRPGLYRLKLVSGPGIWWKSFRLDGKGRVIELPFKAPESRPLTIKAAAFDAATGRELTASARFFLLRGGSWVPLKGVDPAGLRTGTVQRLRAECPGYESAEWSLAIGWYQDELVLEAGLEKTGN